MGDFDCCDTKTHAEPNNQDKAAEILRKHIGMGYGAGSPIRCECKQILKGDMSDRYELLAAHQADMLAKAGIL